MKQKRKLLWTLLVALSMVALIAMERAGVAQLIVELGQQASVEMLDEGTSQSTQVRIIDCVGAGVACTTSGNTGTLTISAGDTLPVSDATSIVEDPADGTKEMRIDVGAVTTGTIRVLTMPDADIDLTLTTGSYTSDIDIDTSAELLAIIGDETGTGLACFATDPTFTGAFVANGSGLVIGHTAKIATDQTAELQVLGGAGDALITIGRFSGNTFPPKVNFVKSRNTAIGSQTIVQDDDQVGELGFYPDDGVDYATKAARFIAEVDDASPAVGDVGMAFAWLQMPGGGGVIAETMRLDAAGTLTVGGSTALVETALDTYGELDTLVADQTLTHNGLIDTSAEVLAIVGDETGTGAMCFATDPTLTGAFIANGSGLVVGHTSKITTDITAELQVLGTSGSGDSVATLGRFSADNVAPRIHFLKSRNAAIGSNAIVLNNDRVGALSFYPDDGVDYATLAARFLAEVDDASPAAGDIGMAFVWKQMPGGAGALATTMTLSAAGVLDVGGNVVVKAADSAGGDLGGTYPTSLTVTDLTIASEATGDILTFDSSNWVRVAAGAEGEVLTAHGAAVPTFDAAGGADLVVQALSGAGHCTGSAGFQILEAFAVCRAADATTIDWTVHVKVPSGATSISSILLFYRSNAGGDVELEFGTSHASTDLSAVVETDLTDTATAYTEGTTAQVLSITVPAAAYNGLTSIQADDIIGIRVRRTGGGGADTSSTNFDMIAFEVTFS